MYVITNTTKEVLKIDGVDISPKQQLNVIKPTVEMLDAQKAGKLRIMDATETLEERRADIAAIRESVPQ